MAQEKINLTAGQTARVGIPLDSTRHDVLFPTGDFTPFTLNSFFRYRRERAQRHFGPCPALTTLFDLTATN